MIDPVEQNETDARVIVASMRRMVEGGEQAVKAMRALIESIQTLPLAMRRELVRQGALELIERLQTVGSSVHDDSGELAGHIIITVPRPTDPNRHRWN